MPHASSTHGAGFLVPFDGSFDGWRPYARQAVLAGLAPTWVSWAPPETAQASLFSEERALPPPKPGAQLRVPRRYVEQARRAACHSDVRRWDLLYRLLWRISHGASDLLDDAPDRDVSKLRKLDAEVRRDCHKMKAFVRFRQVEDDAGEVWIAWHQPDHTIGRLVGAFFQDRFSPMRWSILMPNESLHWDTERLRFGPGAKRAEAPATDELESLWRDYYRAIFNPARVKVSAMKAEMPMKHWSTLPEAQDIAELLREAPARVAKMVEHQHKDATPWLPGEQDISSLSAAIPQCLGCERKCGATNPIQGAMHSPEQGAAGEIASADAWPSLIEPGAVKVIFVAAESAAGDGVEHVLSRLRDQLSALGVQRAHVSLTFAVKQRAAQPTKAAALAKHVTACRPWLLAELQNAPNARIVALGALAARSVLGRHVAPAHAVGRQWEGFGMREVWVIDGARELSRACGAAASEGSPTEDERWRRTAKTLRALAESVRSSTRKRIASEDCATSR